MLSIEEKEHQYQSKVIFKTSKHFKVRQEPEVPGLRLLAKQRVPL